jgi:hypothetical protein
MTFALEVPITASWQVEQLIHAVKSRNSIWKNEVQSVATWATMPSSNPQLSYKKV